MEKLQTDCRLAALIEFMTAIRSNAGIAVISQELLDDLSELRLSEWAAVGIDEPLASYFLGRSPENFLDMLGVIASELSHGRVARVRLNQDTSEAVVIR
jgi:hypothetical protein